MSNSQQQKLALLSSLNTIGLKFKSFNEKFQRNIIVRIRPDPKKLKKFSLKIFQILEIYINIYLFQEFKTMQNQTQSLVVTSQMESNYSIGGTKIKKLLGFYLFFDVLANQPQFFEKLYFSKQLLLQCVIATIDFTVLNDIYLIKIKAAHFKEVQLFWNYVKVTSQVQYLIQQVFVFILILARFINIINSCKQCYYKNNWSGNKYATFFNFLEQLFQFVFSRIFQGFFIARQCVNQILIYIAQILFKNKKNSGEESTQEQNLKHQKQNQSENSSEQQKATCSEMSSKNKKNGIIKKLKKPQKSAKQTANQTISTESESSNNFNNTINFEPENLDNNQFIEQNLQSVQDEEIHQKHQSQSQAYIIPEEELAIKNQNQDNNNIYHYQPPQQPQDIKKIQEVLADQEQEQPNQSIEKIEEKGHEEQKESFIKLERTPEQSVKNDSEDCKPSAVQHYSNNQKLKLKKKFFSNSNNNNNQKKKKSPFTNQSNTHENHYSQYQILNQHSINKELNSFKGDLSPSQRSDSLLTTCSEIKNNCEIPVMFYHTNNSDTYSQINSKTSSRNQSNSQQNNHSNFISDIEAEELLATNHKDNITYNDNNNNNIFQQQHTQQADYIFQGDFELNQNQQQNFFQNFYYQQQQQFQYQQYLLQQQQQQYQQKKKKPLQQDACFQFNFCTYQGEYQIFIQDMMNFDEEFDQQCDIEISVLLLAKIKIFSDLWKQNQENLECSDYFQSKINNYYEVYQSLTQDD